MRTENAFVTQGCVYDFDVRGEDNDQITAFRPGNLGGEVSWLPKVAACSPGMNTDWSRISNTCWFTPHIGTNRRN
jgi:hypothetical protein